MLTIRPKKRLKTAEDEANENPKEVVDASTGDSQQVKQELEQDGADDMRARLQKQIVFHPADTTLNLLTASFGGMLTALREGGLQHLAAGARASVGMKSGRYVFEVTVVDVVAAKSVLRAGVSKAGSDLVLGDHMDCVYFDSDGFVALNGQTKKRKALAGYKLGSGDVIAVVVNLCCDNDDTTHTVSLFKNGSRLLPPQLLPEEFWGEVLYPALSFKGMVVSVNFGPSLREPLPFHCRMLQDAAAADVKILTPSAASTTCAALFPVCLPDEGSFDWIDTYVEKNPQYTEISDRKILDWASRSGSTFTINRQRKCGDRPGTIDDGTAKKLLVEAAGLQRRDIIIMELKGNLLASERKQSLNQLGHFRKVAAVVMGEPSADFKKTMNTTNLAFKQEKLTVAYKARVQARFAQKRLAAVRKEAERRRKDLIKKKQEEQRKRLLETQAKRAEGASVLGSTEAEEKDEEKTEAMKEETVKEEHEVKVEVEELQEDMQEDEKSAEEDPPVAELTAEEKLLDRRIEKTTEDIEQGSLGACVQDFTLPDKEEGFDEIQYAWQNAVESEAYLKAWKTKSKAALRIDNIVPGPFFNQKCSKWQRESLNWRTVQIEFKKKEAQDRAQQARVTTSEQSEDSENKPALFGDISVLHGKDIPVRLGERVNEATRRCSVSVFQIEDIMDVGNGEPLFGQFTPEDWALANLRFDLWLLVHSFQRDANDPDLQGVALEHVCFYYNKYYKKPLSPKAFGVETVEELVDMVKDTVSIDASKNVLVCHMLEEDIEQVDIFLRLTEASRIDRLLRGATGDAHAAAKFLAQNRPFVTIQGQTGQGLIVPTQLDAATTPYMQTLKATMKEMTSRPGMQLTAKEAGLVPMVLMPTVNRVAWAQKAMEIQAARVASGAQPAPVASGLTVPRPVGLIYK